MNNATVSKFILLMIAISFSLALIFPAYAAEKRKFTVTTKTAKTISQSYIYLEDKPRHEMRQRIQKKTMTSTNPDFDGMDVLNYSHTDHVAGTGSHNGYSFYYHKNGDKVFVKWQGTHKTTFKEDKSWESVSEGGLEIIGGTGMFEEIKGGGNYDCFFTPKDQKCDGHYEAEY